VQCYGRKASGIGAHLRNIETATWLAISSGALPKVYICHCRYSGLFAGVDGRDRRTMPAAPASFHLDENQNLADIRWFYGDQIDFTGAAPKVLFQNSPAETFQVHPHDRLAACANYLQVVFFGWHIRLPARI
jgi:hypothetical protein